MRIFIIIFIILLTMIFIPIPIKLTFNLDKAETSLYLYFKKINLKKQTKKAKKSRGNKLVQKLKFLNARNLYSTLKSNPHKPTLKLLMQLEFGFEDAALTGLFYGLNSTIYPFLYQCLGLFFKVNKYTYEPTPNFQNPCFKLKIECIFSLSVAKAIYIFYILRKNYIISENIKFSNSTMSN